MSDPESLPEGSSASDTLETLIQRFREAEAALEGFLKEGVDAVLDPDTGIPILLPETQAQLRTSDSRYRRFLSRSTVVVFELEADGTTLFVNDAIFDLLGYTAQELLGRPWWDVIFRDDQQQQLAELHRLFQTGDVIQYELSLTSKQGSTVIIELYTVNRRQPDGSLHRILGLVLNITERRNAENELAEHHAYLEHLSTTRLAEVRQANFALQRLAELRQRLLLIEQAALIESEQANQMKVQFLAIISHELRTPLTSIKGFSSLLMEINASLDAKSQQEFIAIIDQEADKLAELIGQLIDSAGLQTGKLHIQPKPCHLTAIMSIAMAQLQAVTAQHPLSIHVSPDLAPILADEQRITQVLVNLVGNAAKFSPPGTQITLAAAQHETTVQVDVSDEGSGIALENREKVFETFWQPERLTSGNMKGLGLGLAICQGIIAAHGGNIWVADVSSGTTISFTLPIVILGADAFGAEAVRR